MLFQKRIRVKAICCSLVFWFFGATTALAVPTGVIQHPSGNLAGNLVLAVEVSDPDGISSVGVEFSTGEVITLCSSNCGTSFRGTRTKISPKSLNLTPGSHRLNLWVGDSSNVIDSQTFFWAPREISGLSFTRTTPGEFTIEWSALSGYLRYNVYAASEPGISPDNVNRLADGVAIRAIRGTSSVIQGMPDELGLFAVVTGIDGSGESAFSEELLIPAFENQLPIAEDDTFTIDEDELLEGDLQENDFDPDNLSESVLNGEAEPQTLRSIILVHPENGEVILFEDGRFSYQPAPDFNGIDEFEYELIDSLNGIDTAIVSIEVLPINDPPSATPDSYSFDEDTTLDVDASEGVLANDFDVDEEVVTFNAVLETSPEFGELVLNADGSFTYTPQENFAGEDNFTYSIMDPAPLAEGEIREPVIGTVTLSVININDIPTASDDRYEILEDEVLNADGVAHPTLLSNDIDDDAPEGELAEELTVSLVSDVINGSLSLGADGTFVYTPNFNVFGSDSFTYRVTDSAGLTSDAEVSITIIEQNDIPIANPDTYTTDEDTTLTITGDSGLLANDSDSDNLGNSLIASGPSVTLEGGTLSVSGDGGFVYTPAANFNGTDSFVYTAMDIAGATAESQATITVNPLPDGPIAIDDPGPYVVIAGESITISDALANDSHPDGDSLTIIDASASTGTVSFSGSSITYNAPATFVGDATIDYTIAGADTSLTASASIKVTVEADNEAPIANADVLTVEEDSTGTVDVLANDTDADGDPLSLISFSANNGTVVNSSGGNLLYTPSSNFNGIDTITYIVSDQITQVTGTVSVTVTPVNDAPIAVDDSAGPMEVGQTLTISPLANDSDPDGDSLTIESVSAGIGTASISGSSIIYTATAAGTVSINYTISDGPLTASATISVTVNSASFTGSYDTNGDGVLDMTITSSGGSNYTVEFGSNVDAVLVDLDGDGTFTSVPRNEDGSFSVDLSGSSTLKGQQPDSLTANTVSNFANQPNTVRYIVDGVQFEFIATNLTAAEPGLEFSPSETLPIEFSGTSFDLISRVTPAAGPLANGFGNGTRYELNSGGTGYAMDRNEFRQVSWSLSNGTISINTSSSSEVESTENVYDFDDDSSDGTLAPGYITKAQADTWYSSNSNNSAITVYRRTYTESLSVNENSGYFFKSDNAYTTAIRIPDVGLSLTQETGTNNSTFELIDLNGLSTPQIQQSSLGSEVVLWIPRASGGSYKDMIADLCTFSFTNSTTGTGSCPTDSLIFSFLIIDDPQHVDFGKLHLTFSNLMTATYQWIDNTSTEDTVLTIVTDSSNSNMFSRLDYWIRNPQTILDTTISSFLPGNFLESSFVSSDPNDVDTNGDVKDNATFGWYFDASGQMKRLSGQENPSNGIEVGDTDWYWTVDVANDLALLTARSNTSSSDQFQYSYSQCTDTANSDCFTWRQRTWKPVLIQNNRIWVIEKSAWHENFSTYSNPITLVELIAPRINFYDIDTPVPGAPNSISFNQEPQNSSSVSGFSVSAGSTLSNMNVLANTSDPESDSLSVVSATSNDGTIVINGDNTINFTSTASSSGSATITLILSDGVNHITQTVSVTVTTANNPPGPNNDSYKILSNGSAESIIAAVGVLSNDLDVDEDSLTVTGNTQPANHSGTLTVNADGSFNYHHDGSTNLTDSFTYTVSDGTDSVTATVNVSIHRVNSPPDICAVPHLYAEADKAYSFTATTLDDDEDTITWTATNVPSWLSFNTSTGVLSGTPTTSDSSASNIQITASDGQDTSSLSGFNITLADAFGTNDTLGDYVVQSAMNYVFDIARDNIGNIVIVGATGDVGTNSDFIVMRLLSDGSVDNSFSGDGIAIFDFNNGYDAAKAVAIDKNNRIIVAGIAEDSNYDFGVAILDNNGNLDTSFNGQGYRFFEIGNNQDDFATDVILHDDTHITVLGYTDTAGDGSNHDGVMIHIQQDGNLVTSFGSAGKITVATTKHERIYSAVIDDEGGFYFTGTQINDSDNKDILLGRVYLGQLDTNFDTDGIFHFDHSGNLNDRGRHISFAEDGNLLVGGAYEDDFAIYKFLLTPDRDTSFGINGLRTVDAGGIDIVTDIVPDSKGKFFAFGKSDTNLKSFKFDSSGATDTSYGNLSDGDGSSVLLTNTLSVGLGEFDNATSATLSSASATTDASGQIIYADTDNTDAKIFRGNDLVSNISFGFCDQASIQRSGGPTKYFDTIVQVVEGAAGEFYAVGTTAPSLESQNDLAIYKFGNEQTVTEFGDDGRVTDTTSGDFLTKTAVTTSSQDLIVLGYHSDTQMMARKYNVSGFLMSSFGTSGVQTSFAGVQNTNPFASHIDASDIVTVVAKNSSSAHELYRFDGSDGSMDNTFGDGGKSSYSDVNFTGTSFLVASDGSIFMVGSYSGLAALLKFNSAGSLDTSFGSSGLLTISGGPSDIYSVAQLSNGNLVYLANNAGTAEIRSIDISGNVDSTFGTSGTLSLSGYSVGTHSSIKVDSNNKIWAQLENGQAQEFMLRFTNTGTWDSSFINAGYTLLTHGVSSWTEVEGFTLESTGQVILFGTDNNDFIFAHMDTDGSIINGESKLAIDFFTGEAGNSIALDKQSRIVVAGASTNPSTLVTDASLARFNSDGDYDSTFDSQDSQPEGIHVQSQVNNQFYSGVTINAQAKIIAAGTDNGDLIAIRTDPNDENVDSAWNSGALSNSIGGGDTYNFVNSYSDDEGKTYIVGSKNDKGIVHTISNAGAFSALLETSGYLNHTLGQLSGSSQINAITMGYDGYLYAVGKVFDTDEYDAFIARIDQNGLLDTSFDSDGILYFGQNDGEDQSFNDVTTGATGDPVVAGTDNHEIFIGSFTKTGSTNFSASYNIDGDDVGAAVAIDRFGGIFVGGHSNRGFELLRFNAGGSLLNQYESRNVGDIFEAKDITIDPLGNVYMTGVIQKDQQYDLHVLKYPNAVGPTASGPML